MRLVPRMPDSVRRCDDGWHDYAPTEPLPRLLVYLLRVVRLGAPWVARKAWAVLTALGVSAVATATAVGRLEPGRVAVTAALILVVVLIVGAYRLWSETETDFAVADSDPPAAWSWDPDHRRVQVKNILSVELSVGRDLAQADKEKRLAEASNWTGEVRAVLGSAFGYYEMDEFMGHGLDLDPKQDAERLPARVIYLAELLARADTLPISADFDPEVVRRAWEGLASGDDASDGEDR